ncbi:MAG: aminopeptidase [Chloroflexi bacterium]|nr:aminopeptidase [Chloroflexota bacterium]
MTDQRLQKMAHVLVDYSVDIQPGEKVMIESTTAAEALVREVYRRVLERGGHPHLLLSLPDQDEVFYAAAQAEQLDLPPIFHRQAAEQFDARIRIYAETNTRALSHVDPAQQARRQKALAVVQNTAMQRAAEGTFKWISTQCPTQAYAIEAEMGWHEYQDFLFRANHCDESTPDPVAYWQHIREEQERFIHKFAGRQKVTLKGPNVDLSLSITGRTFLNSCGIHNLPDGEIYTGPVEDSVQGWVRFTYPAVYNGRMVEGVELYFENGRVVKATAQKYAAFLQQMLDTDAGARYLGEFAIGTNFEIDRFTRNILFDEKIGGSFHMALGASYPETGGRNTSAIHWDMICDMRQDAEIRVDGELVYQNGGFLM